MDVHVLVQCSIGKHVQWCTTVKIAMTHSENRQISIYLSAWKTSNQATSFGGWIKSVWPIQLGSASRLIVVMNAALQSSIKHELISNVCVCVHVCLHIWVSDVSQTLFLLHGKTINNIAMLCIRMCRIPVFGFRHLPQIYSFDEILKNESGIDRRQHEKRLHAQLIITIYFSHGFEHK